MEFQQVLAGDAALDNLVRFHQRPRAGPAACGVAGLLLHRRTSFLCRNRPKGSNLYHTPADAGNGEGKFSLLGAEATAKAAVPAWASYTSAAL